MQLRDHTLLGMTQSLCPECLRLVTAKVIELPWPARLLRRELWR